MNSTIRPTIRTPFVIGLAVWLALPSAVSACPFCAKLGKTLSDYVAEADAVVWGRIKSDGTIEVETTVKGGVAPNGIRFRPSDASSSDRKLVFARSQGRNMRPIRVPNATPGVVAYLQKLGTLQSAPKGEKLAFYFRNLDNLETAIADDAYKAFSKLYAAEVVDGASSYDPKKLRSWILDEKKPASRIGLYGLLLGIGGTASDADFLAKCASDDGERLRGGRDGFLGGLAVLDRRRATELILHQLNDPKEKPAGRRAAVGALSFLVFEMPREDPGPLLDRAVPALSFTDVADALIDEFRKAEYWKATDQILKLGSAKGGPSGAVVRYALRCPNRAAQTMASALRKTKPALVADAEQLLRFEAGLGPSMPRLPLVRNESKKNGY